MEPVSLMSVSWQWLLAAVIAVARPVGMLAVNPLLARARLTGLLRGGISIVLALPAIPYLAGKIGSGQHPPIALLLLTLKETAMGAIIGFLLGLPFWAFQFAGDILDQQRGATSGRLGDPAGFEDVSVTGTLFVVTGATLFVTTGGLQTLASLLYASWALWPPLSPMPSPTDQAPALILALLEAVISQGLLLAVPIVVAMLLADVSLILVGRFAPQLRIEDISTSARNLVFCITLPLYCAYLVTYMRQGLLLPPGFLTNLQRGLR